MDSDNLNNFETDEFDSASIAAGELPIYRRSNSFRYRKKDAKRISDRFDSKVIAQRAENPDDSLRNVKIGIGVKFSIPIIVVFILVILAYTYFIAKASSEKIANEILKSGLAQVATLSDYGSMIIEKAYQTYFMYEHKGKYEPWPVDLGLISKQAFLKRVGYYDNESSEGAAETYIMNRKTLFAAQTGGLLKEIIAYRGKDGVLHNTQVLAAYILTNDKKIIDFYSNDYVGDKSHNHDSLLLVRSEMSYEISKGHEGSLPIEQSNWIDKYADISKCVLGGKDVVFNSYSTPCVVYGGIVNFSGSVYSDSDKKSIDVKSLIFDMPIFNNRNKEVGRAIIALRASQIITQFKDIYKVFIFAAIIAICLSIIISVVISFLVTRPVKRLLIDMNAVAKGDLNHETESHSCDEIGVIAREFNRITKLLNLASETEKQAMRLESELEMACKIQMKLLPPRLPEIQNIDLGAAYQPAKEVGGDYYDLFPIDNEHVGMIIADVSGKGVPGSMVMATTRTILRFAAKGNLSSGDTLIKTNSMVAADIKRGMFVTAFYVILDVVNQSILCSSAGHNPMIICHASGELEQYNPNGIALGFDKGGIFSKTIKEDRIKLKKGDRIVLYTDGIVESMNESRQEYTDKKFCQFITDNRGCSSEEFIDKLLNDLDAHQGKAEQHDDITVLTFKVL